MALALRREEQSYPSDLGENGGNVETEKLKARAQREAGLRSRQLIAAWVSENIPFGDTQAAASWVASELGQLFEMLVQLESTRVSVALAKAQRVIKSMQRRLQLQDQSLARMRASLRNVGSSQQQINEI